MEERNRDARGIRGSRKRLEGGQNVKHIDSLFTQLAVIENLLWPRLRSKHWAVLHHKRGEAWKMSWGTEVQAEGAKSRRQNRS